ncbi:hypothetical protein TFKS16_1038 [Tannerella forsythia KS16]|uniref:Uncharacterized protein n=1 Tax=Tannerella forsythia (strain ATCC 43037 / JCM 10827 / CCUG 21028 A / KCTC 5666 / FDC 338) TaxID=203275 RepID=G8UID9_TANFA|nr:hypothetical protein BFO_1124 [Tannerella forsythia 92A2]BAR48597.1 hypothetical protein TF3313_1052 [Tannerella forsythia 3313]BAR51317.1 hypothetical protein TFKS16_1038 [Tannerella forsythia KS16]
MAYIYLRKDSHPFRKTGLISFYFMSVNSLPYKTKITPVFVH